VKTVTTRASLFAYLGLLRPRQWAKNLLVAAAPFAAGVLSSRRVAALVGVGFVAWVLVAGGGYVLNDLRDVAADRRHPRKRNRPLAAGRVAPDRALLLGVGCVAAGLGVGVVAAGAGFAALLAGYVALTVAYSWGLKQVALLDVAVIAVGFVLRAVSGGVLVGVPISGWFLLVVAAGAVFVAAGKRHGERAELGAGGGGHRAALDGYPAGFLETLVVVAAAVMALGYAGWAFAGPGRVAGVWPSVSVVPFLLVVGRYSRLVFAGRGGEPEALFLTDRTLQGLLVAWAALLALGLGVA